MPFLNLDPAAATVVASTAGAPLVSQEETLTSLSDELLAMLGGRDDIDPSRLTRWINEGYRDLASSLDLAVFHIGLTFNSVAAQSMYLFPTQILRTSRAALTDATLSDGGTPLTKIDPDYFRGLPDLTGAPNSYFFQNQLFVVYPKPSAVYAIAVDAYIVPQKLAAGTDSPLVSSVWYEALLLAARAKAFRGLLEWELAANAQNDFISHIRGKTNMQAEERSGIVAAFRPARTLRSRNRFSPPREDY